MPDRLAGVVDGVLGGDLNGWLANLDDPSVCETVIVRDAGGAQREFRTFQLREDVCAALGLPGTFGFSVPLASLSDFGARISVHDRYGAPLTDGLGLDIGGPHAAAAPAGVKLFLHIPKTAGTSLRNDMAARLPYSATLLVYPGSDVGISATQLDAMPDHQKRQFRVVFGHYYVGLHARFPQPSQYVAVLREARSRLRSNVMHHATTGTVFVYDGQPCPPSVAINEGLEEELDNVMTRTIAGVTKDQVPLGQMSSCELDMAMEAIRRRFLFLGRYENLPDDTTRLCRALGLPPAPLSTANRTADRPIVYPDDELQKIDWPTLFARNRIDILLYSALDREKLFSRALSPHP